MYKPLIHLPLLQTWHRLSVMNELLNMGKGVQKHKGKLADFQNALKQSGLTETRFWKDEDNDDEAEGDA